MVVMKMNKKRLAVLTTLVAISLSGGLVYASPSEEAVDTREVVVTATRHAEEVKAVPSAVEIITAEDIQAIGADNLTSALRMATNLNLSEAGMTGNAVSLRGMSTNHTLILIDGKRMAGEDTSVTQNVYQLNRLNISDVERIEIVRGPGSALYGSDAMGGVINIITKRPDKQQTQIGLSTGSRETANWYNFDLGKQGKVSASFDMRFSKVRENGFDASGSSDDTYTYIGDNTNMYGNKQYYNLDIGYDLGNTKELRFQTSYMKERLSAKYADVSMMGMMYSTKDKHERFDNERKDISLEYTGKTKRGDYQLRAYYSKLKKDSELFNSRSSFPGMMETILGGMYPKYDFDKAEYDQFVLEGRNTMQLNDEHLLTFGGEYRYDGYEGTRLGDGASNVTSITQNGVTKDSSEESTNSYAAYVQDEWMIGDKLLVIPALRFDHHNTYGSNFSPKIGMTYNMNRDVRVKASYGKGFKAPTISELYMAMHRAMGGSTVNVYGNPDLEPEKATSYDISIEAEKNGNFGKLTYFASDVSNLITTETKFENGVYNGRYVNVDKAEIDGIEAELGRHFNDNWTFRVVNTYLDAVDKSDNSRLEGRAENILSLRLEYNDCKEDAFGMMLWSDIVSGYRYDDKNHDYSLTNICFTKEFGNVEAYFGIDNIFDKVVDDLYIDGRQWRLGVSMTI